MEPLPSPDSDQTDPSQLKQHRFESANDFLEICDRLNNGYESGLYWEDVQRALRIAAGLENWPN